MKWFTKTDPQVGEHSAQIRELYDLVKAHSARIAALEAMVREQSTQIREIWLKLADASGRIVALERKHPEE